MKTTFEPSEFSHISSEELSKVSESETPIVSTNEMLSLSSKETQSNSATELLNKSRSAMPKISVIVTTYNWPSALETILCALNQQTFKDFEVIIADDGSKSETAEMIAAMRTMCDVSIRHVWQEDLGFRVARIRNLAIHAARGEYIIFLDGDCVPRTNFLSNHMSLREAGYFVAGNRVLLNQTFTQKVLKDEINIYEWSFFLWMSARLEGCCNRLLSFISLPLGKLRKLMPNRWQGAKGCNLAVWKEDLIRINGFEEEFTGWGYEDSDLVIRLIRLGIKRKEGRFSVPVIHLWHPENDRQQERTNWALLQTRQQQGIFFGQKGLNQHHVNVKN